MCAYTHADHPAYAADDFEDEDCSRDGFGRDVDDEEEAEDDELPAGFDPNRWDDFGADFDDEEPEPEPGDFWPEEEADESL